jgi:hypothetical protein|tara:strand:+ start:174 stop:398 length:225 start_codon:yes stop_codon:yes gene_type:complete
MKKYIVTVDLKKSITYEVEANSESEAYEKMHSAHFPDALKPVHFRTGEPIPGIEYSHCEVWQNEIWNNIRELEE